MPVSAMVSVVGCDRGVGEVGHCRVARRDVGRVAGQPEVGDAHGTVSPDHHVLGLEVTMHEAGLVGGQQPLAGRGEHFADGPPRSWFSGQPVRQGLTFDELHRQVDATAECLVVDRTRVVHDDDVGMRKARDRLRLTEQTLLSGLHLRRLPGRFVEQLQRDLPIEARIVGGVDFTHPAPANQAQDGVTTDRGPGNQPTLFRKDVRNDRRAELFRGSSGAGGHQVGTGRAIGQMTFELARSSSLRLPSTNARTESSSRQVRRSPGVTRLISWPWLPEAK